MRARDHEMPQADPLKTTHYIEKTESFVTPKGRMTFVAIDKKFKHKERKREDDEGEYAVALLLPPDADISKLVAAVNEKIGGKKGYKKPFAKAEDKEIRGLEDVDLTGWILIRANTYRARPGVKRRDGTTVDVENLREEAYPGRWARISVKPHAYAAQAGGSPGVKFYLNNVQLLDDDERLGGGGSVDPDDEFEALGETGGGSAEGMFD